MHLFIGWAVFVLILLGVVGGWFPLWKSARLSPDSIQRRVFWSCCTAAVLLCFLGALPDWRSSLFVSGCTAVAMTAIAFYWTNHLKIGGRVYAAFPSNRRPDRPPALSKDG